MSKGASLIRHWRHVASRLWRRVASCRRGEHRDTIVCSFGILEWYCADCETCRVLGFVFLHASNKVPHHWRWERPGDGDA